MQVRRFAVLQCVRCQVAQLRGVGLDEVRDEIGVGRVGRKCAVLGEGSASAQHQNVSLAGRPQPPTSMPLEHPILNRRLAMQALVEPCDHVASRAQCTEQLVDFLTSLKERANRPIRILRINLAWARAALEDSASMIAKAYPRAAAHADDYEVPSATVASQYARRQVCRWSRAACHEDSETCALYVQLIGRRSRLLSTPRPPVAGGIANLQVAERHAAQICRRSAFRAHPRVMRIQCAIGRQDRRAL